MKIFSKRFLFGKKHRYAPNHIQKMPRYIRFPRRPTPQSFGAEKVSPLPNAVSENGLLNDVTNKLIAKFRRKDMSDEFTPDGGGIDMSSPSQPNYFSNLKRQWDAIPTDRESIADWITSRGEIPDPSGLGVVPWVDEGGDVAPTPLGNWVEKNIYARLRERGRKVGRILPSYVDTNKWKDRDPLEMMSQDYRHEFVFYPNFKFLRYVEPDVYQLPGRYKSRDNFFNQNENYRTAYGLNYVPS